jgi:hypothetical protein
MNMLIQTGIRKAKVIPIPRAACALALEDAELNGGATVMLKGFSRLVLVNSHVRGARRDGRTRQSYA